MIEKSMGTFNDYFIERKGRRGERERGELSGSTHQFYLSDFLEDI
jgi:hypothetical protein